MTSIPLPYRIPQQGIAFIEASAGTGKTHTLIRLIARHILWYNKSLEQILAVTFTEAATAELRVRLREFLYAIQNFYKSPFDDNDIEYLISEAPPELTEAELYLRLTAAIGNIDNASIFTIHGFCQRILNEQPILTGQSIPGPKFIENQNELIEQICFEFWRRIGQDEMYGEVLQQTWSSPEQMHHMANDLLSNASLTPPKPLDLVPPDFETALTQFKKIYLQHNVQAQQILIHAIESKALNGVTHKVNKTIAQFQALANFFAAPNKSAALDLNQIAASKFKVSKNGVAPTNALFEAVDQWLIFADCYQQFRQKLCLCLIHDFRDFLQERLIAVKNQRNLMSFDDLIDRLHQSLYGSQGPELAAQLRATYPVALVDEFQDTDDRQWAIFTAIYAQQQNISLTLIGDPKQAIYAFRGGDIHTYLKARKNAQYFESLTDNYRSNADVVNAVNNLFTFKDAHPFYEHDIDFIPIQAKLNLGQLFINHVKIPALQIIPITPNTEGKAQNKATATLLCAQHCANQIAWLCGQIALQQAEIKSESHSRLLMHHDIAVLVATNKQTKLMQRCLNELSVASVCVEKSSVFNSYEALDVLNVMHFINNPSGRQQQQNAGQGVLLQCLLGNNALSGFDLSLYQELWHRHGPLSCFNRILVCAENIILALPNGERRLSNYWQIVELIQNECVHFIEQTEILDWLTRQIETSNEYMLDNSSQNPRPESGADRVRILTLHQSKGLEFGIVYMPFTAISQSKNKHKNKLLRYFDGQQRCLYFQQDNLEQAFASKIKLEQDSENLRVLYVGITRAKFALSISYGAVKDIESCALSRVLLGTEAITLELIQQTMQAFPLSLVQHSTALLKPLKTYAIASNFLSNTRMLNDSWRVTSFSGLHQSKEQPYSNPASDEHYAVLAGEHNPYRGTAFGNALHHVLEHAKKSDWNVKSPNLLNQNARQLALSSMIQFGYNAKSAELGVMILCALVYDTMHGLLPEQICLMQIPENNMRHELEFHLSLNNAKCSELLTLLHQYNYCLNRQQFGFQQHLNGLLTGKIDLIYSHQNIFYIADYKSNLLDDYQYSSLADSIQSQEYDLQYILYCVALHRYLKHKMGAQYQYEQHFGGVRYLYSRGMRSGQTSGIFSDRPTFTLIKQLDFCFSSVVRNSHVA